MQNNIREIAIIDLGSNSFHMIIARIVNGSVQILSRLKQKVQLAKGLNQDRFLSQEAIDRGVACLALFAKRLQGFPTENVKVIGTYTLRRALNKQQFLEQASQVFPYPINIVSGQQEATLIYAGASHTQPEQGRKFVIDIGGGSTELVIGDNFTPLRAESCHMGCVSFAKRFFANGCISQTHFQQAYLLAKEKLSSLQKAYCQLGWQHVLGSSGTIKTVSQVLTANGAKDGLITAKGLTWLIQETTKVKHFNDLQLSGLNPNRVDVFIPGLAILMAIFDSFNIASMRYSSGALREGIIYTFETQFAVQDIRQRTLNALIQQFNLDTLQSERVDYTLKQLIPQVMQWQKPETLTEIEQLLSYAAKTYEIGLVINHENLQYHSAYLLQNMSLPGFDSEQQKLLATFAHYHLKEFKLDNLPHFNRYHSQDVLTALILFRLSVLFNTARQATKRCENITLNCINPTKWEIKVDVDYLRQNPLIQQNLINESQQLTNVGITLTLAS
ncbi:exopolyphosphatase [Mergibacter septicus]|uniref:Ppx/GppA phosphatase family protein n=1 Tax=Mergibacter septicus TaxID=221402 RepID=UPI001C7504C5|nr:exopolyphosphatase [Mergibacter septicus]QDJ13463.1 exopolyphosphatase [Mergibacter septicus]